MGVFWPCPATGPRRQADRPPRHAAAVRAGVVEPGGEGGRAVLLPRRQGPLPRRHVRAADRGRGRRLPGHPDHRAGGQHVPHRATRRGGSARWWTSTPSRCWNCTRILAKKHGIADGDWVTVESRRGRMTVRCQVVTTIRPDVVFVPYHWAGEKSINLVTISVAGPDLEDPRVQGVRRAASARPRSRSTPDRARTAAVTPSRRCAVDDEPRWSSSSTRPGASAARRASTPAPSARRTRGTR